jgi:hypothetical protein
VHFGCHKRDIVKFKSVMCMVPKFNLHIKIIHKRDRHLSHIDSYLVLAPLYGRFTITIARHIERVTLNTIFSLVPYYLDRRAEPPLGKNVVIVFKRGRVFFGWRIGNFDPVAFDGMAIGHRSKSELL